MPWTPRDAKKYKKGLSPRQSRQWSRVANSVLQRCLADGGTQARCEASAIRQANGAVGTPARPTSHRLITVNTALTVPPSRIVLNHQEYLTAPVVMLVEGVLNGGLVQAEDLHPQDWAGVAVTVNHPADATGQPHSARQPDVLATCGVGQVFHPALGTGQRNGHAVMSLRGELWINLGTVPLCGAEAQQAVTMLESQTPLEVSTAFYSDTEPARGSFYGTRYTEIHHNLRPDHLALLPNAIGACDWQSGCGAPRLNTAALTYASPCACADHTSCTCHEGDTPMTETPSLTRLHRFWQVMKDFVTQTEPPEPDEPPVPLRVPVPDEDEDEEAEDNDEETGDASEEEPEESEVVTNQTDQDVREALYGCLCREMGRDITPVYIQDVDHETQTFTYRQGERLRRRYWQMVDGLVTLADEIEDVQRTTSYTAIPGTAEAAAESYDDDREEMTPMATEHRVLPLMVKTRVNRLIANGDKTGWTELDRGRLEAMDEATLLRLESLPQAPAPLPVREGYRTLAEVLDEVDPDERNAVQAGIVAYKKRKSQLIDLLIANTNNPFAKEELVTMEVERLEKMVLMSGEDLPETQPRPIAQQQYAGRRMPQIRVVTEEDDVPPPPRTMEAVVERQKAMGLR